MSDIKRLLIAPKGHERKVHRLMATCMACYVPWPCMAVYRETVEKMAARLERAGVLADAAEATEDLWDPPHLSVNRRGNILRAALKAFREGRE